MEHTLRAHMEADVLPGPIRVTVEGCLTEDSCRSLFTVLDPALGLQGCPRIRIDLRALEHLEPAGLQALERYVSHHEPRRGFPTVSIVAPPLPRQCSASALAQHSQDSSGEEALPVGNAGSVEDRAAMPAGPPPAGPPPSTAVRELMSPIGPTVHQSQPLEEATREIAVHGEPVVVVDDSYRPVSVITEADLDVASAGDPEGWQKIPCGFLAEVSDGYVRVDHPVEGVVWEYQHGQIRPLLVFHGSEAVGILHPTAVFQWCAEHWPTVLSSLSRRAAERALVPSGPVQGTVLEKR